MILIISLAFLRLVIGESEMGLRAEYVSINVNGLATRLELAELLFITDDVKLLFIGIDLPMLELLLDSGFVGVFWLL